MTISSTLAAWYQKNKRDLPWRHDRNPYQIWLSEIILQQTRVNQGLPYYYKFIQAFPTIVELAESPEDKVMKLWQGLGYYSRARNLHTAAKQVHSLHNGQFPRDYASILALKGVGEYTAAAIASQAFGLPHAVVDGNVYRVLSRLFAIQEPIDSTSGKKIFLKTAQELLDTNDPGNYNQALMEFGAIQCKPVSPDCSLCPFADICAAYKNKLVDLLPIKAKKTKVRERFFHYMVVHGAQGWLLKKRSGKDIWQNLYDFPCIESERSLSNEEIQASAEWTRHLMDPKQATIRRSKVYKHLLSHQTIYAVFIDIEHKAAEYSMIPENTLVAESLESYSVPRLIERYMEERDGR